MTRPVSPSWACLVAGVVLGVLATAAAAAVWLLRNSPWAE